MATQFSKSHVLAGVQDAYWSDEETEDAECPLCLEEMDLSDMGFKPCPCGYQICRFCWHHIKENLNGRCPACRREYVEEAVEFKAVSQEDMRRLNQQKKNKEKERKELEALGRKHLTNVRVVQRNVVYITGVGSRFAREELISTLRSNEYFGQYGKISKILLVKRSSPSGSGKPVVGLYVTYHRKEDASRAIAAVDGTPSPSRNGEITRASYGTTKYCIAFLRGVGCSNKGCLDLHEWGDERDCFTKEDLSTLKHAMKDTELNGKKAQQEEISTRRNNSWTSGSNKTNHSLHAFAATNKANGVSSSSVRGKTSKDSPTSRTTRGSRTSSTHDVAYSTRRDDRRERDKEKGRKSRRVGSSVKTSDHNKAASQDSASPPTSPTTSVQDIRAITPAADSDRASSAAELGTSPPGVESTIHALGEKLAHAPSSAIPDAPPGLNAPITPGSTPNDIVHASSYQPSTAAQALLDDMRSRRRQSSISTNAVDGIDGNVISPFPDFDRTLRNLGLTSGASQNDGGLKFTFDFGTEDNDGALLESDGGTFNLDPASNGTFTPMPPVAASTLGYSGGFNPFDSSGKGIDTTSAPWAAPAPPPLGGEGLPSQAAGAARYRGTFDPFADTTSVVPPQKSSPAPSFTTSADGERTTSRFGFARRPTPASRTTAVLSQSNHGSNRGSPMSPADALPASPFMSHADVLSPKPSLQTQRPWSPQTQLSSSSDGVLPPPPGLIPSTSISLSQLFGPSFSVRRNSLKSTVESPVIPSAVPPGLVAPARVETNIRPINLNRIEERQAMYPNFIDPAIVGSQVGATGRHGMPMSDMAYSNPQSTLETMVSPIDHNTSVNSLSLASMGFAVDDTASSLYGSQARDIASVSSLTGASLPTSPLHASFTSLSRPSSPIAETTSPELLQSDFPALPSTATNEAPPKVGLAPQPHIQPQAPKISTSSAKTTEPKVAPAKNEKEKKSQPKKGGTEPAPTKTSTEEKKKGLKAKAKTQTLPIIETQPKPSTAPAPAKSVSPPPTTAPVTPKSKVVAQSKVVVPQVPEPQAPLLSRQSKKEKKSKSKSKASKSNSPSESVANTPAPDSAPASPELPPKAELATIAEVDKPTTRHLRAADVRPLTRVCTIVDFLRVLDSQMQQCLSEMAFFDTEKINPKSQVPLQYGPLVHALSALSVGGGTFSNSLPSRSIDTAVSSFQSLLETLTQTISELLRLLPRTTWDDSSSFDGVLKDMLKGDEFFDEPGEAVAVKEDEVAALTQALERRARWMEVQLSKLEELHRDINNAAVRAILTLNDHGWDATGFLPRVGGSIKRFDELGRREVKGQTETLPISELEKKLERSLELERASEHDLRKSIDMMTMLKYKAIDDWSA